jgi:TolB-like protein
LLVSFAQAESVKPRIAVLDFELCGKKLSTDTLDSMVAEWFITALVKDGRFQVVERALLHKILAEQKLGVSGVIDDSSASKLGKILGVKLVVTGSIILLGEQMEVNSRVINVEDGAITAAENVQCPNGADLQKVVEDLTAKIVRQFPLMGYVVQKDTTAVFIDVGQDAGVQMGMEFEVFKEGNIISHPKTGEILDVERLHTGRVKVVRIQGNVAEATIVQEEKDGGIEYGHRVESLQPPKTAATKKHSAGKVQLADSPVFLDSEKPHDGKSVSEIRYDRNSGVKNVDRPPVRPTSEPRKKLVAVTARCQDLLKSWQLGDASVMQQYKQECAQ